MLPPQTLTCNFCQTNFIPHDHNQKRFCSKECRDQFWNNEKRKNHWKPVHAPSKICIYCKQAFKPIRKTQKFCSIKCLITVHPPPHNNTGIYQIKFWTNREWIEKNYLKPKISISQVCQKYQISKGMFFRWLKRLNIKSLPKSIVQKGDQNPYFGKKHPPEIRHKMSKPHPTQQGANNHEWKGGRPKCIDCGKQLHDYINKRCRNCYHKYSRGENHHGWKGGKEPYYGPDWQSHQKQARARDNNACQDCGLYQTKPRLHVHHKIPFRYFKLEKHQEANKLSNLITVCVPCHGKRHIIINSFNYQSLTDFPEYQYLSIP